MATNETSFTFIRHVGFGLANFELFRFGENGKKKNSFKIQKHHEKRAFRENTRNKKVREGVNI